MVTTCNPHLRAVLGHLEGEQPCLGDLLNMVMNHLLTGMISKCGLESTG